MSARASTSFGHGLAAAFVLSTAGAALLAVLTPWLGGVTTLRAVTALLGFAYVLYLMARSGERVGRVTTIACYAIVTGGAWLIGLPLVAYVLVQVGVIWLVRSLYHYSGLMPALADLALSTLAAAFAAWAALRSGSPWLAFWCFFLVQALHAVIPPALGARSTATVASDTEDAFARAARAAEEAVRRLSSNPR
jgi:hypothetical protein